MTLTKLVNVKVKFIRPKYKNLKEWMADPNNIYIGRGRVVFIDGKRFPENDSIFANPFKIDSENSRDKVIEKYREYIIKKLGENLRTELEKLVGCNLGCWCYPEMCHGNVLLDLISKLVA